MFIHIDRWHLVQITEQICTFWWKETKCLSYNTSCSITAQTYKGDDKNLLEKACGGPGFPCVLVELRLGLLCLQRGVADYEYSDLSVSALTGRWSGIRQGSRSAWTPTLSPLFHISTPMHSKKL